MFKDGIVTLHLLRHKSAVYGVAKHFHKLPVVNQQWPLHQPKLPLPVRESFVFGLNFKLIYATKHILHFVIRTDADDDEVDLFGSDDEEDDAEAARIREERVAAYAAKKSKKPTLIAKSSVLLDVKPWDDETDMKKMEECVRTIQWDGLLWGAAKLVPVGYGINKLQIMCVIEDDKISTDELTEKIEEFEDYVQSVDIAAFNKI